MGNNTPYVKPIFNAIKYRDFFDYDIFTKELCYGRITNGGTSVYIDRSVMIELNAQNEHIRIVRAAYGYMYIRINLSPEIVVEWLIYKILNNQTLEFTGDKEFMDKNLDYIQVKLAKLNYKIIESDNGYNLEKI